MTITRQAARVRMTHRCTIQRDGQSGTDDYGQPDAPSWADHLTSQACRYYEGATGREVEEPGKTAVIYEPRLLLPHGTDVTEEDRVTAITDRQSNALISETVGIRQVIDHPTQLTVILETVRS